MVEGYCDVYNCGYHTELFIIVGLGQFCEKHAMRKLLQHRIDITGYKHA